MMKQNKMQNERTNQRKLVYNKLNLCYIFLR